MTPKEKAQDLVNKMLQFTDWHEGDAKQCALIAVDEIIKSNAMLPPNLNWLEVKKEIELL
jgi:hypothetical protein